MQQRPSASSSRPPQQDHCLIDMPEQQQDQEANKYGSRRFAIESGLLPHRSISRIIRQETFIHAIPFIVVFCVLILWWFSYPEYLLEIKDVRIGAIAHVKLPLPFNNSHVKLAVFSFAMDANAAIVPVPEDLLVINNETAPYPATKWNWLT